MTEQRLVVRLLGYWERIRKDDTIPDFRKNNPAMIEDLWQQCFVLSVIPSKEKTYKYEYLGDKVKELHGSDYTGMIFDLRNKQFPNSVVASGLNEMFAHNNITTPKEEQGQVPSPDGKLFKYRTILLPFGNEKAGVTHLVCGVSYREF